MSLLNRIFLSNWEKAIILCGVLGVLLPTSPMNMPFTYRDSGVFLYTGWRILHGELPYLDIWDHKPPIVFYINALGLLLSNNSRWGVWVIELFTLIFAGTLCFYLFKKIFGSIPSVISLIFCLLTLGFLIQGGNLTEEYALPLQFLALWLACDINKPNISPWRYFLIGFIGTLAFFTKQTTIGIWIAIIFYITLQKFSSRQFKPWIHNLIYLSASSLIFILVVVIFFSIHGAFWEFWNAAFDFNFVYSTPITGITNRLAPITSGLAPLRRTGLFQIAMLGYILSIIYIFNEKDEIKQLSPLLYIGLIGLPIELILVSTSGRTYPHYYIAMLPILSLFAGVVFWVFYSKLSGFKKKYQAYFFIIIMSILLWKPCYSYYNEIIPYKPTMDDQIINYVKNSTTPDESVLFWGAESSINYLTQRKSPSRFVYQYPLYTKGYTDAEMIEEFLNDIIQNRPQLIIDTKNPKTPLFDFPIHTTTIDNSIKYIKAHYRMKGDIGSWSIYELINNP